MMSIYRMKLAKSIMAAARMEHCELITSHSWHLSQRFITSETREWASPALVCNKLPSMLRSGQASPEFIHLSQ